MIEEPSGNSSAQGINQVLPFPPANISGEKVSLTETTITNVWKGVTNKIELESNENGEYLIATGDRGEHYLYLNFFSKQQGRTFFFFLKNS